MKTITEEHSCMTSTRIMRTLQHPKCISMIKNRLNIINYKNDKYFRHTLQDQQEHVQVKDKSFPLLPRNMTNNKSILKHQSKEY